MTEPREEPTGQEKLKPSEPEQVGTNLPPGESPAPRHPMGDPAGEKGENDKAGELAAFKEAQIQAEVERVYNIAFFEEAQGKLQEHELESDTKESLRMRLFPLEEYDEEPSVVHERLESKKKEHPDLIAVLETQKAQKEEKIKREYEAAWNDNVRRLLRENDLEGRFQEAMRRMEFPQDYDRTDTAAFNAQLKQDMESNGELMQAMNDNTEELRKAEAKRLVPEKEPEPEEPDDPSLTDQEKKDRLQDHQNELDKAAREAWEKSKNNPLDLDARRDAAEKMEEARQHHDKHGPHGADALEKGTPWWSHVLTGVGVAFYIYVALQYAAASAAVAYGEGGGKGK